MGDGSGGGAMWRVVVTILATAAWIVFMLYWIGFIWNSYEVQQNIVVLCISGVVFSGLVALVWTIWPRKRS